MEAVLLDRFGETVREVYVEGSGVDGCEIFFGTTPQQRGQSSSAEYVFRCQQGESKVPSDNG